MHQPALGPGIWHPPKHYCSTHHCKATSWELDQLFDVPLPHHKDFDLDSILPGPSAVKHSWEVTEAPCHKTPNLPKMIRCPCTRNHRTGPLSMSWQVRAVLVVWEEPIQYQAGSYNIFGWSVYLSLSSFLVITVAGWVWQVPPRGCCFNGKLVSASAERFIMATRHPGQWPKLIWSSCCVWKNTAACFDTCWCWTQPSSFMYQIFFSMVMRCPWMLEGRRNCTKCHSEQAKIGH